MVYPQPVEDDVHMGHGLILPGVTAVPCPVCRAVPGRPCKNRRGYLADLGSHRQRRAAWLADERDAQRRREARTHA